MNNRRNRLQKEIYGIAIVSAAHGTGPNQTLAEFAIAVGPEIFDIHAVRHGGKIVVAAQGLQNLLVNFRNRRAFVEMRAELRFKAIQLGVLIIKVELGILTLWLNLMYRERIFQ